MNTEFEYDDLIHRYLDGTHSETESRLLFQALANNPELQEEFQRAVRLQNILRDTAASYTAPADLADRVMTSVGLNTSTQTVGADAASEIAASTAVGTKNLSLGLIALGFFAAGVFASWALIQTKNTTNSSELKTLSRNEQFSGSSSSERASTGTTQLQLDKSANRSAGNTADRSADKTTDIASNNAAEKTHTNRVGSASSVTAGNNRSKQVEFASAQSVTTSELHEGTTRNTVPSKTSRLQAAPDQQRASLAAHSSVQRTVGAQQVYSVTSGKIEAARNKGVATTAGGLKQHNVLHRSKQGSSSYLASQQHSTEELNHQATAHSNSLHGATPALIAKTLQKAENKMSTETSLSDNSALHAKQTPDIASSATASSSSSSPSLAASPTKIGATTTVQTASSLTTTSPSLQKEHTESVKQTNETTQQNAHSTPALALASKSPSSAFDGIMKSLLPDVVHCSLGAVFSRSANVSGATQAALESDIQARDWSLGCSWMANSWLSFGVLGGSEYLPLYLVVNTDGPTRYQLENSRLWIAGLTTLRFSLDADQNWNVLASAHGGLSNAGAHYGASIGASYAVSKQIQLALSPEYRLQFLKDASTQYRAARIGLDLRLFYTL